MERRLVICLVVACLTLGASHLVAAEPETRIFFPLSAKLAEEFPDSAEEVSIVCGSVFGPVNTIPQSREAERFLSDRKFLLESIEPVIRRAFPDLTQDQLEGLSAEAAESINWVSPDAFGGPGGLNVLRSRAAELRRGWAVVRWSPTFDAFPEERLREVLQPGVVVGGGLGPHRVLSSRALTPGDRRVWWVGALWLGTTEAHLGIDIIERISRELVAHLEEYEPKRLKEEGEEWQAKLQEGHKEQESLKARREELEKKYNFREAEEAGPAGARKTVYVGEFELLTPLRELLTTTEARSFEQEMNIVAVQSQLAYVRDHLAEEPQVLQVPGETLSAEQRAAVKGEIQVVERRLAALKNLQDVGRVPQAEVDQAELALMQAVAKLGPRTVATMNPAWSTLKQRLVELETESVGLEAAARLLQKELGRQRGQLAGALEYLRLRDRLRELPKELREAESAVASYRERLASWTEPPANEPPWAIDHVVEIALPAAVAQPGQKVDPKYLKPMGSPDE